ncbi:hypothetical protein PMEGAPL103_56090 [Priestia megaterium]
MAENITIYSQLLKLDMKYCPLELLKVDFIAKVVPTIKTSTKALANGVIVWASVTVPVREAGFDASVKGTV